MAKGIAGWTGWFRGVVFPKQSFSERSLQQFTCNSAYSNPHWSVWASSRQSNIVSPTIHWFADAPEFDLDFYGIVQGEGQAGWASGSGGFRPQMLSLPAGDSGELVRQARPPPDLEFAHGQRPRESHLQALRRAKPGGADAAVYRRGLRGGRGRSYCVGRVGGLRIQKVPRPGPHFDRFSATPPSLSSHTTSLLRANSRGSPGSTAALPIPGGA